MDMSESEWNEYYDMYLEGIKRGKQGDREWENRQCHQNANDLAGSAAMLGYVHGQAGEGPYSAKYLSKNYA